MISVRTITITLGVMLLGSMVSKGQGTEINNGVPNNKWLLHNPEDPRKTLFLAPNYNGSWDFNQQTQFRPNGDVTFSGKILVGTIDNRSASSQLEVIGDFRTTTGRFSSIYSQNTDGMYPANVVSTNGDAQLSIGANWNSGASDLSFINSNIANTQFGGFSFWQMTDNQARRSLVYFQGNGKVGVGTMSPETQLHVNGSTPILSTGPGSGFKFRNWNAGAVADVDDWEWYARDNIARFHKVNVGDLLTISNTGNVGIGTDSPGGYRLAVEGKIGAREVEVKTGSWADFVFAPDYRLPSLEEVETHIKTKQHLPGIPTTAEVVANGIELGQMNTKLLQKIEELTLYAIEQHKRIQLLEQQMKLVLATKERNN